MDAGHVEDEDRVVPELRRDEDRGAGKRDRTHQHRQQHEPERPVGPEPLPRDGGRDGAIGPFPQERRGHLDAGAT
jgi:hypothetical protein